MSLPSQGLFVWTVHCRDDSSGDEFSFGGDEKPVDESKDDSVAKTTPDTTSKAKAESKDAETTEEAKTEEEPKMPAFSFGAKPAAKTEPKPSAPTGGFTFGVSGNSAVPMAPATEGKAPNDRSLLGGIRVKSRACREFDLETLFIPLL